ncbi:MAG: hypothetical protein MUF51_07855 [Vicinamibacteria bacterium]|jgi:hypothetical protein|nr:hypothetical protein [Vicinamibacteria bacterium]
MSTISPTVRFRPSARRILAVLLLPALVVQPGCGLWPRKEPTLDELREQAVTARDQARQAANERKVKAAERAASRAEALAEAAKRRPECATETAQRPPGCNETAALAAEARRIANRADEVERLADITGSLKAKAYRAGRKIAMRAALAGMVAALVLAESKKIESLPEPAAAAVVLAGALVAAVVMFNPIACDQKPSSREEASRIELKQALGLWADEPPLSLSWILSLGFSLVSRPELALIEIDAAATQPLSCPDAANIQRILRGLALSEAGLRILAVEEFEAAAASMAEGESRQLSGRELAGWIHMGLAYLHWSIGSRRAADLEAVRAMQVWPDNPAAVFLTGERLAADGRFEEAAESLEKEAKGTEYEGLAKRLSARARKLRDSKGEAEPLLTDKGILIELLVITAKEASRRSEVGRRLNEGLEAARNFAEQVIEKVPGL